MSNTLQGSPKRARERNKGKRERSVKRAKNNFGIAYVRKALNGRRHLDLGRHGKSVMNVDCDCDCAAHVAADADCDRRVAVAINGTHKRNAQELNATNYCLFVLVELIGRHGQRMRRSSRGWVRQRERERGNRGIYGIRCFTGKYCAVKFVNSISNLFIAVQHCSAFSCASPPSLFPLGTLFPPIRFLIRQQQQQQQQRQFYRYNNKSKIYKSYFRFYLAAFSL